MVLFEVTSDGIVYSRSFTNLGGKHLVIQCHVALTFITQQHGDRFENRSSLM